MKKKIIKNNTAKGVSKKKVQRESLIKEENGKCVLVFDIQSDTQTKQQIVPSLVNFGLVAVFLNEAIPIEKIFARAPTIVYGEKKTSIGEVVFSFKKKYLNQMRETEESYFSGKINIDAKLILTIMQHAFGLSNMKIVGWKETLKNMKKI
ncbi:MAG: hypothetical protein WCO09_01015 [bacterium]